MKTARTEIQESARLWALNIKHDVDGAYEDDQGKVRITLMDLAEALLALAGVEWQYVRRIGDRPVNRNGRRIKRGI